MTWCRPGTRSPIWRTAGEKSGEWSMDEPRNLAFGGMEWTDDAPGIRAREAEVGDKRWATVLFLIDD